MKDIYALIVEDQPDSAELVARILTFHNRSSVIATSAENAIALLEEHRPQIIILDLTLPAVDGWGLLKIIRNIPLIARVPVIAITAHHYAAVAREAVKAGFNAYFSKPLDATSFARELDRMIEIARWTSPQTQEVSAITDSHDVPQKFPKQTSAVVAQPIKDAP